MNTYIENLAYILAKFSMEVFMHINRELYLNRIISFMWDGQVKVITCIRRCRKSYLLNTMFSTYLINYGIKEDHILNYELDLARDIKYRNPLVLAESVR